MCHFSCWLVRTADLMIHYISPHASTCSIRSALCAFLLGDFSTLENALNLTFTCPVIGKQRHQKDLCLSVWFSHVCAFSVVKEKRNPSSGFPDLLHSCFAVDCVTFSSSPAMPAQCRFWDKSKHAHST